jgi:Notch-like protein
MVKPNAAAVALVPPNGAFVLKPVLSCSLLLWHLFMHLHLHLFMHLHLHLYWHSLLWHLFMLAAVALCSYWLLWHLLMLAAVALVHAVCGVAGKTALHWAAAVNNLEAVVCLLQRGANRGAQDHRNQTPLFLAAKEGSFEACRSLLDHYANRDMTDHMDHLPRDVAKERRHQDIVKLLDEYRAAAAYGGHQMHYGHGGGGGKKSKKKAKSMSMHTLQEPGGPMSPHHKGQVVKLPAAQKKRKKKAAAAAEAASAASAESRESLESTTDLPPSYKLACAHISQPAMHLAAAAAPSSTAASQLASGGGAVNALYKDPMDYVKEENLSPEAWLDNVPSNNPGNNNNNTAVVVAGMTCISPPSSSSPYSNGSPPSLCYPVPSPPRRSLPLSHTHLAAIHHSAATSGGVNQNPGGYYQHLPHPHQQHRHHPHPHPPMTAEQLDPHYLTPSPDSPSHWSSASPQSDWSEGISSPVQPAPGSNAPPTPAPKPPRKPQPPKPPRKPQPPKPPPRTSTLGGAATLNSTGVYL